MSSLNTSKKSPLGMNLSLSPVVIALFCIYFIWGFTKMGNKIALESYPPFMLVAIRLLVALIILLVVLRVRGIAFPSMNQMLNASFIGALMFGGQSGLLAFARSHGVGTGMVSLGVATIPVWAVIFAFFLGYKPSRLEIVGLVIGISGMAILNIGNDMDSHSIGAFVLLFSPMIWSFGSIYSQHIEMPSGFMATAFQMTGGCTTLFVMSLISGEQFPTNPSLRATGALVLLAILGTLVAFSAYTYLLQTVSPGLATSYAYVNPIVALIFGAILLGETLPSAGLVATVVIGIGVLLIIMGKNETQPTSD